MNKFLDAKELSHGFFVQKVPKRLKYEIVDLSANRSISFSVGEMRNLYLFLCEEFSNAEAVEKNAEAVKDE